MVNAFIYPTHRVTRKDATVTFTSPAVLRLNGTRKAGIGFVRVYSSHRTPRPRACSASAGRPSSPPTSRRSRSPGRCTSAGDGDPDPEHQANLAALRKALCGPAEARDPDVAQPPPTIAEVRRLRQDSERALDQGQVDEALALYAEAGAGAFLLAWDAGLL